MNQWPHLDGVSIPLIDAEVRLLIGSDVLEALDSVKIRHNEYGDPMHQERALVGQ